MNEENARSTRPVKTVWFIIIMGVLLPIVTLVLEACFRILQGSFFDPLPTFLHGVMIAMVPLANAMLARSLVLERPALSIAQSWLHAFAMGVSLLYAILFLPFTPFAAIGIIWFGIGLLPLAPLLSLIAAALGRKSLKRITGAAPPFLWRGMALALAAVIALDAPATVTRIGLHMATAQAPGTRLFGVRWLRAIGNKDIMLRHCHAQSGMISGAVGSLLDLHSQVGPDQARSVFYRVTGTPFNSLPAPAAHSRYNWQDPFDWRNAFDAERGGDAVGQQAVGVALASSRMDGSIDAKAALAYLEWTMVFKNSSAGPQEGRAEVILPPGAVVSRATLWIDGEEREAAFGGRGQVRAAYEKVVRQNRDPLLVTTAGTDRVLVQLFPIPANGEMKIRIGITAPMTMRALHQARLQLPSFSERNFEIDKALRHAVWVESGSALQGGPELRAEQVSDKLFALRGELAEPLAANIAAARTASGLAVWSADDKGGDGQIIVQTLSQKPVAAPHRVAIVIDGSLSMASARTALIDTLAALPAQAELAYVFAGDARAALVPHERGNFLANKRYLEGLDFEGGRDNSAALGTAWDWAGAMPAGAIVWIHGAQPETGDATEALLQRFERRPAQVAIYDVEAAAGPNAIARKLDGHAIMHRVAREGALGADLRTLYAQWAPGALQVVAARRRQAAGGMDGAARTSTHLARLWASGQVAALGADPKQQSEAVAMAVRYQLVTPLSGAVVLETKQQYDEAGLEPVAPGSVPTIPEPETWLLIIVALGVLALRYRKRAP